MPSQPSDNEPVSVDDWYHTKNSAPTTTEVLLCTLLIQLVVGNGREGFMGAVEAEMAPNSVPQGGGGGGDMEGMKTARTQPRLASRYLGMAPSN
jgi:hypothetical protein